MQLIENKIYRRTALHQHFGGQRQGGISTPARFPIILLFSGETGHAHGYSDGWQEGIYRYYGEGQVGDMRWVAGNAKIRDHAKLGLDILLFEILAKPRSHVRYIGQFNAGSWEYGRAPDRNGDMRQAIVFHLSPVQEVEAESRKTSSTDLRSLRKLAIAAGTEAPQRGVKDARRTYIERSSAIRDYALARANGHCERCGLPAPFNTAADQPFLEVHHIRRLSDGGPDKPDSVAAICPNCHREAHHGKLSVELNKTLLSSIRNLETSISQREEK